MGLIFEGDRTITLFDHSGDNWEPSGEVRLPVHLDDLHSLSMSEGAEEVLISAKSGGVHRWHLKSPTPGIAASPHRTSSTMNLEWQGTCDLGGGHLAHLASRPKVGLSTVTSELFVSARM